tara:strand:- start:670 stop:1467 length:798 start_codon:yes stop_codon:yes gene_type:complete
MEKNLKQYVKKFNPILETEMFSKEECEMIVNKLIERQDKWESRSPLGDFFMSYGALTYLDAVGGVADDEEYDQFRNTDRSIPNIYAKKANYFNKMMIKDFDWMYRKIWGYYQMKFHKPVVFKLALPGFHIFQTAEQLNNEDAKNLATIHVDMPHTSHNWGEEVLAVSSFTIAVDLPKCGAGLNIWRDNSIFKDAESVFFNKINKKTQLAITKTAEYFPYKLGYVYEQDGMLRHQITCNGDIIDGERRITVQGHLVETSREIIIYV